MIRLRIMQKFMSQCICHSLIIGYTLKQSTDISQRVTVILTNLIKAGKDYQCSVTLFVTSVSFFCYWVRAIFVCLRDLWIILYVFEVQPTSCSRV